MMSSRRSITSSVIRELDPADGHLEGVSPLGGPYPTFRNRNIAFRPGRSLCRFGLPFEQLAVTFEHVRSVFSLDKP